MGLQQPQKCIFSGTYYHVASFQAFNVAMNNMDLLACLNQFPNILFSQINSGFYSCALCLAFSNLYFFFLDFLLYNGV